MTKKWKLCMVALAVTICSACGASAQGKPADSVENSSAGESSQSALEAASSPSSRTESTSEPETEYPLIPVDALEAQKLLLAFWTDVEENMSDYTLSGQACTEYGLLGGFNDGPLPTAQYPEVPADGTEYAYEILAMVKDDNYLYEYTSGEANSRVGYSYVLLQSDAWSLEASGFGFSLIQKATKKTANFWAPEPGRRGHDNIYFMLADWYEEASGTAFVDLDGHEAWHSNLADSTWYDFYTR